MLVVMGHHSTDMADDCPPAHVADSHLKACGVESPCSKMDIRLGVSTVVSEAICCGEAFQCHLAAHTSGPLFPFVALPATLFSAQITCSLRKKPGKSTAGVVIKSHRAIFRGIISRIICNIRVHIQPR